MGVKSQMISQCGVSTCRSGVAPGSGYRTLCSGAEIPINGLAFEFAEAAFLVDTEQVHVDVTLRQVVSRWMACLQQSIGSASIGYCVGVELDAHSLKARLHARRAGIIPNRFFIHIVATLMMLCDLRFLLRFVLVVAHLIRMTETNTDTKTWPDLAIGLYDKLTGRGAEITYEFHGLEVSVPSSASADAEHGTWKVSGTMKVRTKDETTAARS